jgi:beta-lactam-binding protein with PASTA domain
MTLEAARSRIVEAGCAVGRVRSVSSAQVGIVLAQSPAPGTTLPAGGRVALTVGRA